MDDVHYLDLVDFLLIAEEVIGVEADVIARFDRIHLAESALAAPQAGFAGVEAYPEFTAKAAILCSHLVWNHPLPDGNKRVGYLCLREFVARNGYTWTSAGTDETVQMIERLAAGLVSELDLQHWIERRLS